MILIIDEITQKLNSLNLINIDSNLSEKIVIMAIESVKDFITYEISPFIQIPQIKNIFIDIAIGEYLSLIKYSNLEKEGLVDEAIKSITEGDTSITYFEENKNNKIDMLISYFLDKKKLLLDFKTIRW